MCFQIVVDFSSIWLSQYSLYKQVSLNILILQMKNREVQRDQVAFSR
jgi:hypothetical protein